MSEREVSMPIARNILLDCRDEGEPPSMLSMMARTTFDAERAFLIENDLVEYDLNEGNIRYGYLILTSRGKEYLRLNNSLESL